jgi:hypothetical protein
MKEKIRNEVMKIFNQEANVDDVVDNIMQLIVIQITGTPKKLKEIYIGDIAIFSNSDEEGKKIIEFFVKNGAQNIWQHKGNHRKYYNTAWTEHIKDHTIYTLNGEESIEKFKMTVLTLKELSEYLVVKKRINK